MPVKRLLTLPQYLLPQHLLSRLLGKLANAQNETLKNFLIRLFIRHYKVNLAEAADTALADYPTFNTFFTRALQKNARLLPAETNRIISPADGMISQIGTIESGRIFQAKGHHFSVAELLGEEQANNIFQNGSFATIYLAPKDYHRVHIPCAGKLTKMIYIPGRLFSVNTRTASTVPKLFARNERVVCWFETEFGPMVVILVGAFFVASIATVWHGIVAPRSLRKPTQWKYDDAPAFNQGDELGYFQFGSTAIVLFPRNTVQWQAEAKAGDTVKMGQVLGARCT